MFPQNYWRIPLALVLFVFLSGSSYGQMGGHKKIAFKGGSHRLKKKVNLHPVAAYSNIQFDFDSSVLEQKNILQDATITSQSTAYVAAVAAFAKLSHLEAFNSLKSEVDSISVNQSADEINGNYDKSYQTDFSHILNSRDFGRLYLLDIFKSDSCTHGNKVYDVVKEVLTQYHLDSDSILQKIKTLPINYFSNQVYGDSVLKEYIGNSDDEDYNTYSIPETIKEKYKNNDFHTPESYLIALVNKCLNERPDIISSSFTVMSHTPLAYMIDNENEATNWVTSATNKSENIAGWREPVYSNGRARTLEPISSLLRYNKNQTLIVGCQTDADKFSGMFGEGVTVLGKGKGYGISNFAECIKPTDVGTSFATPETATKLYIAKAYWRKNNIHLDPTDIVRRAILATDLHNSFVSKFDAGGCINLEKLLQTSVGYLVTNRDSIIQVDSLVDSHIFSVNNIGFAKYFMFGNKNSSETSGLYLNDSVFFIFRNEKRAWERIDTPDQLNITIYTKGHEYPQIIKLEDFKKNYKQFVLLKPQL